MSPAADTAANAPKRYSYFDHEADVGVVGRGATIEEAFVAAAEATFALMAPRRSSRAARDLRIEFVESDPAIALERWLNALLDAARDGSVVPTSFELYRKADRWIGRAHGAAVYRATDRVVEVKSATNASTSVAARDASGWEVRCVLEV